MAALPYMPLYVADYLADAAHLSTLAHGAYLLLIMTYWHRGGALPCEDRKLARIARMTIDEWAEIRDDIAEFFHEKGGKWHHKRIDAELLSIEEKSMKARRSAEARHSRNATAQRTQCDRTANAEQSQCHTDTDTDTKKKNILALRFDELWKIYPSRGRARNPKAPARKKFESLVKSGIPPDDIIRGAKIYAETMEEMEKAGTEFVAQMKTWLNQESWKDAVDAETEQQAETANSAERMAKLETDRIERERKRELMSRREIGDNSLTDSECAEADQLIIERNRRWREERPKSIAELRT